MFARQLARPVNEEYDTDPAQPWPSALFLPNHCRYAEEVLNASICPPLFLVFPFFLISFTTSSGRGFIHESTITFGHQIGVRFIS